MKSYQFQKTTKLVLPFAILWGIAVMFFYNFPLTLSDLTLSAKGLKGLLGESVGNYGTDLLCGLTLSGGLVCNVIFASLLALCVVLLLSYNDADRSYLYYLTMAMVLVAPKGIFGHTYASVQGAARTLIPTALLLTYLATMCDLFRFKGRKKTWKIPFVFLWGLMTSLFDEGLAVAALILSILLAVLLIKKHGFNAHALAHTIGVLGGFVFSLSVGGSYQAPAASLVTVVRQFSKAVDALFLYNWFVIGVLTVISLFYMRPARTERSANCNRTLFLLLGSVVLLLALRVTDSALLAYPTVDLYLSAIKLVAAGMFLFGLYRVAQHYVSKDYVTLRVRNNIFAVIVCIAVYTFTDGATEEFLFFPFLTMVSCALSLFVNLTRRYSSLEASMKKYFIAFGVLICGVMCFITISNAQTIGVMDRYAREQIDAGQTEIILPALPYGAYGDPDLQVGSVLSGEYGTVTFAPYDQWDWATYFETHNVPIIEEYDPEKASTENDVIFEEDLQ